MFFRNKKSKLIIDDKNTCIQQNLFWIKLLKTASAIGERQILPRQTNSTPRLFDDIVRMMIKRMECLQNLDVNSCQ